ncbi:unnamed protein product [Callosobruchus maculatus]|uniref:Uncharacterized protein n=1 Tax=Callosobruchus maculatus TaxID=64391 RepID=A0A653DMI6_CALMS|nr:unnamed protein product [Callosobruchus maculatus]
MGLHPVRVARGSSGGAYRNR